MHPRSTQGSSTPSSRVHTNNSPSTTTWKAARSEQKKKAMASPLSSPTLATSTARFRHKLPSQGRRCLPVYLGCVFIFIIILNLDVVFYVAPTKRIFTRQQTPHRPRIPGSTFPQKIWQTWKVDPFNFMEAEVGNARTWVEKNPSMRYEVLTDANELSYVEEFFGPDRINRPDIVQFYKSINLTIVKADLLRYMVMYAEGGVYTDIDVEALKPLSRFIPDRYDESTIDMIVGVEIDQPEFRDHPILGKKAMSFCQWTFASRPRQPVMLRLIENIMAWLKDIARKQGVSIGEVTLDFDQVISGTGPSAFTAALLEEMARNNKGRKVAWDEFHNLDESKVVGGVLVLNVEAFCAGQGHSDSGNHNARHALVKHHYHASNWPSKHPRYMHPVYGQVEDCNWKPECVRRWDENVAAWKELSEEEKKQKIEEHHQFLLAMQH